MIEESLLIAENALLIIIITMRIIMTIIIVPITIIVIIFLCGLRLLEVFYVKNHKPTQISCT